MCTRVYGNKWQTKPTIEHMYYYMHEFEYKTTYLIIINGDIENQEVLLCSGNRERESFDLRWKRKGLKPDAKY